MGLYFRLFSHPLPPPTAITNFWGSGDIFWCTKNHLLMSYKKRFPEAHFLFTFDQNLIGICGTTWHSSFSPYDVVFLAVFFFAKTSLHSLLSLGIKILLSRDRVEESPLPTISKPMTGTLPVDKVPGFDNLLGHFDSVSLWCSTFVWCLLRLMMRYCSCLDRVCGRHTVGT